MTRILLLGQVHRRIDQDLMASRVLPRLPRPWRNLSLRSSAADLRWKGFEILETSKARGCLHRGTTLRMRHTSLCVHAHALAQSSQAFGQMCAESSGEVCGRQRSMANDNTPVPPHLHVKTYLQQRSIRRWFRQDYVCCFLSTIDFLFAVFMTRFSFVGSTGSASGC